MGSSPRWSAARGPTRSSPRSAPRRRSRPSEPAAYLNYLAVDPDLQGQAIGRRLVDAGIAAADADGLGTYLGTTDPRNLPFYRRLGYVEAGAVPLGPDGPSSPSCTAIRTRRAPRTT